MQASPTPAPSAALLHPNSLATVLVGVSAALLGAAGAIFLMPDDFSSPHSLREPAFVLSCGVLAVPLAKALINPLSVMRTEHLFCFGLIYWLLLDLLQGAYALDAVPREALEGAFLALGVCGASMWVGSLGRGLPMPAPVLRAAATELSTRTWFVLGCVCFALGMLYYWYRSDFDAARMIAALGGSRWSMPWARGKLGDWDAFVEHLCYFGYLLPPIAVILARKRGWISLQTLLIVAAAIVVAMFLAQGGGRRVIGVAGGAALLTWVLLRQRLRITEIVVLGMGVGLLLAMMQVVLTYRTVGLSEAFKETPTRTRYSQKRYDHIHVDDNILRLAQAIDLVPSSHPYVYEKQLFFILARPVPRALWPEKPVDPGFDLAKLTHNTGTSLSMSFIGECYVSYGLVAVIIGGLLYGALARTAAQFVSCNTDTGRVMYALAGMALFAGIRSLQDLILMSYTILCIVVLLGFVRSRTTTTAPTGASSLGGTV